MMTFVVFYAMPSEPGTEVDDLGTGHLRSRALLSLEVDDLGTGHLRYRAQLHT